MTKQLLPQKNILVDVAFNDANEQAKQLAYPTGELMLGLSIFRSTHPDAAD